MCNLLEKKLWTIVFCCCFFCFLFFWFFFVFLLFFSSNLSNLRPLDFNILSQSPSKVKCILHWIMIDFRHPFDEFALLLENTNLTVKLWSNWNKNLKLPVNHCIFLKYQESFNNILRLIALNLLRNKKLCWYSPDWGCGWSG